METDTLVRLKPSHEPIFWQICRWGCYRRPFCRSALHQWCKLKSGISLPGHLEPKTVQSASIICMSTLCGYLVQGWKTMHKELENANSPWEDLRDGFTSQMNRNFRLVVRGNTLIMRGILSNEEEIARGILMAHFPLLMRLLFFWVHKVGSVSSAAVFQQSSKSFMNEFTCVEILFT